MKRYFFFILFCYSISIFGQQKSIVVYGDTRTNHDIHQKVVDAIESVDPVAVFHTGDLVGYGVMAKNWEVFDTITDSMRKKSKFYPALGNHEMESKKFYNHFDVPKTGYYSENINGIHFIVLNSNIDVSKESEQYKWLEDDLKSVDDSVLFKIIVMHHPPFSTGKHQPDEKSLRKSIVPLFEKYGVDIVFSGHDHCYERSFVNGIYYII
ncbi:MAG: hypothetical protein C0594_07645, partial [Marinilabiliales bacterium]